MTNTTGFLYDLQQLLAKHKASLTVDDHWMGRPECGQDLRISIDIDGECDVLEFDHIDSDSLSKVIDYRRTEGI